MENFSKHFIEVVLVLVLIAVGYRYYQYITEKNFILEINTACNSELEKCFEAEPDISFGQSPYKKVTIVANYAPACLEEHSCENFICPTNATVEECQITYCSDETKVDKESCSK